MVCTNGRGGEQITASLRSSHWWNPQWLLINQIAGAAVSATKRADTLSGLDRIKTRLLAQRARRASLFALTI